MDPGRSTVKEGRGRTRARGTVHRIIPEEPAGPAESGAGNKEHEQLGAAQQLTIPPAIDPPTVEVTPPPEAPPTPEEATTEAQAEIQRLQITGYGQHPGGGKMRTLVVTRPAHILSKRAKRITPVNLVTNYFQVSTGPAWDIHQYMVKFDPPFGEDETRLRKAVFRNISGKLPTHVFDGLMLFIVATQLPDCPAVYETQDKHTNQRITITIDCHNVIARGDPCCYQIYNLFVRKCLEHCGLVEIGRRNFDPARKVKLPKFGLEIWPGFATSLRFHEESLLLNVEMVNKVIHTVTILEMIRRIRQNYRGQDTTGEAIRQLIKDEVVGRIVMTTYNRRTYPIADILWDKTPNDTFPKKDKEITYLEYYRTKHGVIINDETQPLLLCAHKERDVRKHGAAALQHIILVPETCVLTGMTEYMRNNFELKKAMGQHLFPEPVKRVDSLKTFMNRLCGLDKVQEEMNKWKIHFNPYSLVRLEGNKLSEEKVFADNREYGYTEFSTAKILQNKLHEPLEMQDWVVIVPKREAEDARRFIGDIIKVSKPMKFGTGRYNVIELNDIRSNTYIDKIKEEVARAKGKLAMMFIVLPNSKLDLYSRIKQLLSVDYGVPSQCCLPKTLKSKGLSVPSKVALQMSCKVGGVPWIIKNPLKKAKVCVMGFDVYHHGGMQSGYSFGALVATINEELSKYCSFIQRHEERQEVSDKMGVEVLKCLDAYFKANNGSLPGMIFFYRDGVGMGQFDIVYEQEVTVVKDAIKTFYQEKNMEEPKFCFIIVSKRINTRFMVDQGRGLFGNPLPGTCVDDVVTLENRFDFFIVSQIARQGTVSPTSYNVIHDSTMLDPGKVQQFTWKMCHNYYNWTGSISVPSVCQNAHKLAYLTGEALKKGCSDKLRFLPHYL